MGAEGILLLTPADLAETPLPPFPLPLPPRIALGDTEASYLHAAFEKAHLHPQHRQHLACSMLLFWVITTLIIQQVNAHRAFK